MDKQSSDPADARWFIRAATVLGFPRRSRRTVLMTALGYVRTDLAAPSPPRCESMIRISVARPRLQPSRDSGYSRRYR